MRIQADEVREIRRFFNNMTQARLAEATRLSQPIIAAVETGSRPITTNFQRKLIEGLKLQPEIIESIRKATQIYEESKRQFND
ncbi:helix-turn-helix domain-containing protein [Bacillus sp. UMB0893]|uniref:helix-turn-helix domain-containing protein n=1 Tax=Bacillus sp. UMB0893 TaxID=2066053 RepID=UPI000C77623A|nr:helix-turn-helix transcriptional regulator [Bacillus sp. UMB0893]PLR65984.1 hypothetical protein CYJ36_20125 [Bacillus sp. UMB0893]